MGGTITVLNTVNVQTGGGHAFLANGAAGTITITNGTTITSTGVGAALAAIGGTIDATGVTMTGTAASRGHGAVAESGGTIFLHAGTSIQRGGAFNAIGLGASGARQSGHSRCAGAGDHARPRCHGRLPA